VRPEGIDEMVIGTLSSRQGHETSFAQLLDEWLGMRPDCVRLVTGDTRPRGDRRRLAFGTLAAPRQPRTKLAGAAAPARPPSGGL